jgi:hypothetical protein
MFARKFPKRKHRPHLESLEGKQLLSAALPSSTPVPPAQVVTLVASQPQPAHIQPDGTGRGIIIITS